MTATCPRFQRPTPANPAILQILGDGETARLAPAEAVNLKTRGRFFAQVQLPEQTMPAAPHGAVSTHNEADRLAIVTGGGELPAETLRALAAAKRTFPKSTIENTRALSQPDPMGRSMHDFDETLRGGAAAGVRYEYP